MSKFKRIHLIVMDSVGIGETKDAKQYGDAGSHTLLHTAEFMDGLNLPNLAKLGLSNIEKIPGVPKADKPLAYHTKLQERSIGKDTMTGHWEIMGLNIDKPFNVFPNGFPDDLIKQIEKITGRKIVGNKPASGTDIIDEYGQHHMKTGDLIIYTSADPVLQIAAHEEVIPLEELYDICKKVREITKDPSYLIGRIIARPFIGTPGNFARTTNRHDYALKPFKKTVMNSLQDEGYDVIAIGKINDIFDGEGVTKSIRTENNMDGMDKLLEIIDKDFTGLSFLNLVDFDALYGHRRDPKGYGEALESFDVRLEEVIDALHEEDLLIITADHGNDPTFPGTDHTRECIPVLVFSKKLKHAGKLPENDTFADIGATIADNFSVNMPSNGSSFLQMLK